MKAFLKLLPFVALSSLVIAAPVQDNAVTADFKLDLHLSGETSISPPAGVTEADIAVDPVAHTLWELFELVVAVNERINKTLEMASPEPSKYAKASLESEIAKLLKVKIDLLESCTNVISQELATGRTPQMDVKWIVVRLVADLGHTLRGVLSFLPMDATMKPLITQLLKSLLSLVKPLLNHTTGLLDSVIGLLNSVLGGLGLGGVLNILFDVLDFTNIQ